jgi:hypothetical protein
MIGSGSSESAVEVTSGGAASRSSVDVIGLSFFFDAGVAMIPSSTISRRLFRAVDDADEVTMTSSSNSEDVTSFRRIDDMVEIDSTFEIMTMCGQGEDQTSTSTIYNTTDYITIRNETGALVGNYSLSFIVFY